MNDQLQKQILATSIIDDLGIQALPDGAKIELLNSISEMVGLRLMNRVGSLLSESDRADFVKHFESGDEDLDQWLSAHGVPFQEILIEEMAKAKVELKQEADTVR